MLHGILLTVFPGYSQLIRIIVKIAEKVDLLSRFFNVLICRQQTKYLIKARQSSHVQAKKFYINLFYTINKYGEKKISDPK